MNIIITSLFVVASIATRFGSLSSDWIYELEPQFDFLSSNGISFPKRILDLELALARNIPRYLIKPSALGTEI